MMYKKLTMRFEGISPLLMSNGDQVPDPAAETPKKKAARNKERELEACCYRAENGHLQFPCIAFRNSLLTSLTGMKVGKTSAVRHFQAAVFEIDDFAPVILPKKPNVDKREPGKEYRCNRARVVNNNCRPPAAMIAYRPQFDEWAVEIEFEFDTDYVTPDLVEKHWNIAGKKVGVGAWRPDKRGKYGRYTAKVMKAEK